MTMAASSAASSCSNSTSPIYGNLPHSPSRSPPLECDYDVNPTYLYQAIEARQWDPTRTFLGSSSNASTEAQTWVIRKEPDGKLRWRLLPLHAAVIFGAPLDILESLLSEHPSGASSKDDQGMLPLHLAFRNKSDWECLEELLTAYPQAISVKDRRGRTPLQCASSKMKKQASVLELYTHVAVTCERHAIQKQSKLQMEAKIGALQENHIQTLERLKSEWQERSLSLERELQARDAQYQQLQQAHDEQGQELEHTKNLEQELNVKLNQVTEALRQVSDSNTTSQAEAATREAAAAETTALLTSRTRELAAAKQQSNKLELENRALCKVVEKLMKQHAELEAKLQQHQESQEQDYQQRQTQWKEWQEMDATRYRKANGDIQVIQAQLQENLLEVELQLSDLETKENGDAAPPPLPPAPPSPRATTPSTTAAAASPRRKESPRATTTTASSPRAKESPKAAAATTPRRKDVPSPRASPRGAVATAARAQRKKTKAMAMENSQPTKPSTPDPDEAASREPPGHVA